MPPNVTDSVSDEDSGLSSRNSALNDEAELLLRSRSDVVYNALQPFAHHDSNHSGFIELDELRQSLDVANRAMKPDTGINLVKVDLPKTNVEKILDPYRVRREDDFAKTIRAATYSRVLEDLSSNEQKFDALKSLQNDGGSGISEADLQACLELPYAQVGLEFLADQSKWIDADKTGTISVKQIQALTQDPRIEPLEQAGCQAVLNQFGDDEEIRKHGIPIASLPAMLDAVRTKLALPIYDPADIERFHAARYQLPQTYTELPRYWPAMKEVFGQSRFEIGRDHNQIIDVPLHKIMAERGIDKSKPITLVNFDSHSDLYLKDSDDGCPGIADWVNTMLAENPQINEFFWVAPSELEGAPFMAHDGNQSTSQNPHIDLFINKSSGEMYWLSQDNPRGDNFKGSNNYRLVQIHKLTLDALPDMTGKAVIWSTDLDAFDNRGVDTYRARQVVWQGEKGFEDMIKGMNEKHVKPFFHFVSISPEYIRSQHKDDLLRFAVRTGEASPQGNDINITNSLKNHIHYYDRSEKDSYAGSVIPRASDPKYALLYRLFVNDALTSKPDGQLLLKSSQRPLGETREELNRALEDVKKIYTFKRITGDTRMAGDRIRPVDEDTAMQLLRQLDEEDGRVDGYVNFRKIEQQIIKKNAHSD